MKRVLLFASLILLLVGGTTILKKPIFSSEHSNMAPPDVKSVDLSSNEIESAAVELENIGEMDRELELAESESKGSLESIYSMNRSAYEAYYQEKRKRRMEGYSKSKAPEEWAKLERQRRTPSDLTEPAYTSDYMIEAYRKAINERSVSRSAEDVVFESQGPGNLGGRTRALLVDPRDPTGDTWIAGSATGGVWKTTNGGQAWTHLTPDLPNLGTNTLAFSAANPDVIYLGTGEHFTRDIDGAGMFKTEDGGSTWMQVASPEDYPDFRNVSRIVVDPSNPDVVVATTSSTVWSDEGRQSAIYRSDDGGASWTRTFSTEETRCDDLDYNPMNFNTMYAALNGMGIAKSVDAGATWTVIPLELTNFIFGENVFGRVELTVSPVDTAWIWASVDPGILAYSQDAGQSWNQAIVKNQFDLVDEFLGGQGWYDNIITAHPFERNAVYVGGVNLFKFEVDEEEVDSIVLSKLETRSLNSTEVEALGGYFVFENSLEEPRDWEVRFGEGGQRAHRYSLLATAEEGFIPSLFFDEVRYEDYVEVPFQVWDPSTGQQLSVVFLDCNGDGSFNLIDIDSDSECIAEQMAFGFIPYSEEPNQDLMDVNYFGENEYVSLTVFGAPVENGDEVDLDLVAPFSIGRYSEDAVGQRTNVTTISDAYGEFNGNNNFGFDNLVSGKGNHPDQHNIITQIVDSSSQAFRLIVANDGGLYVTDVDTAPGELDGSFTSVSQGYVTSQFYGADKAPGTDRFIGGTQDNGTWFTPDEQGAGADNRYVFGIGGDGFECLWNQRNPDWIIGSIYNNVFRYTRDGGQSWQDPNTTEVIGTGPFVSQLSNHVSSPESIYAVGFSGVWKSTNFGADWELNPINSQEWLGGFAVGNPRLEVSLSDPNVIWAGGTHDDFNRIHVSMDGGETFSLTNSYEGAVLGPISGIGTHPHDSNTGYALFSFAGRAKVLRSADLGQTWEDISGFDSTGVSSRGFPDVATNCLFVFPNDTNRIWVGTEIGIVESMDNGESWNLIEGELGAANVHNMILRDDKIVIASYGSGIWTATVDGLEAEEIVFLPYIESVDKILDEEDYESVIAFSNAFDSSVILVNGDVVDTLYDVGIDNDYSYVIDQSLLRDSTNTMQVIAYLDGEQYVSSEYKFELLFVLEVLSLYENDLEQEERDVEFSLDELIIESGGDLLEGRSLQSLHPYREGGGIYTAMLLHPIRIEDQILSYRDIAIVEPGNEGVEFGEFGFWDYVAVEASTDGSNWEVMKVYDANYDSLWLQAYESGQEPDSSLFVEHEIRLTDFYDEGEVVLIRFTLFSDDFTNGWGWLVDDIYIGPEQMTVSTSEKRAEATVRIYPNPASDVLNISSDELLSSYSLYDLTGRALMERTLNSQTREDRLLLADLAKGVYLLKVTTRSGKSKTQQVVIN